MRRAFGTTAILALASALLSAACWKTVDADGGFDEPIRVRQAGANLPIAFVHGAIPGIEAPDAGPAQGDADAGASDGGVEDASPPSGLRITTIESQNNVVYLGENGKKLAGHASAGARAIGVRFADLGSGYWSFPVDAPDPQTPGEVTWDALCDFARTIPPGIHRLRFVPFDESGAAGELRDLTLCVPSATEGLHVCDPKRPPPAAVIELTWDRPVDLDLHVVTPDGKDVSPKTPSTVSSSSDGGLVVNPATDGVIDRDSNAGCVIDGANRETLTWDAYPMPGLYELRANLYSGCGQPSVRFTIVVSVAVGDGPDRTLVERYRQSGVLIDDGETLGDGVGLFVSDFQF